MRRSEQARIEGVAVAREERVGGGDREGRRAESTGNESRLARTRQTAHNHDVVNFQGVSQGQSDAGSGGHRVLWKSLEL